MPDIKRGIQTKEKMRTNMIIFLKKGHAMYLQISNNMKSQT